MLRARGPRRGRIPACLQLLAFYVTLPPEQLDAFDGSTLLEPLQNLANELRLMVEPTP